MIALRVRIFWRSFAIFAGFNAAVLLALPVCAEDVGGNLDDLDFLRFNYQVEGTRVMNQGPYTVTVPGITDLQANLEKFRSSADVLSYLLKERPLLSRQFVLLHHSESLQLASPEYPRVIVFEGGMAFAFSEDPMNREDHVEVMQVDPLTRTAAFHDIVFRNGRAEVTLNAKACKSCHGEAPRPVWAPYDFWPNAYAGSVGMSNSRQERESYQKLKANQANSRILSLLEMPNVLELPFERNTAFTQYIYQIGFSQWVEKELKGRPLNGFEYALLGQTNACAGQGANRDEIWSNLQGFFKPGEIAKYRSFFDQIYNDLVAERRIMNGYQLGLLHQFFPSPTFDFVMDHDRLSGQMAALAGFRWVLEMAKVNGNNLGLMHVGSDSSFQTPGFDLLDLQTTMYALHPQLFMGLNIRRPEYAGVKWAILDCRQLQSLSQTKDRKWPDSFSWKGALSVKNERPVVARCAKCHSEGADPLAPTIPFSDSRQLAKMIRDPKVRLGEKMKRRIRDRGKGQMPPDQPLTASEIENLEAFIEGLQ